MTDPDEITFYDISPKYQERLLAWLPGRTLVVEASHEGFKVYGGDREARGPDLEAAINDVIGSRARPGQLDEEFGQRVREWLTANGAILAISLAQADEFHVRLDAGDRSASATDEDIEVALVIAEDDFVGVEAAPERLAPTVRGEFGAPTVRGDFGAPTVRGDFGAPTVREDFLGAPTVRDIEPETEEAPTRLFGGEAERTLAVPYSENARWTRAYIDSLPDSAFLHVDRGGRRDARGRTHPLTLRHLPYKNRSGRVDQRHLLSAISRLGQPKTDLPASLKRELQHRARGIYERQFGAAPDELAANRRGQNYATWVPEVSDQLEAIGAHFDDAAPAYWRQLYQAGFSPDEAVAEFGVQHRESLGIRRNAAPPAPSSRQRGRGQPSALHVARRMIAQDEAEHRRRERPFDPEAPREHYAKPHHFAVNHARKRYADKDILREVTLGDTGYVLVTWDPHRRGTHGKTSIGYAFYAPGESVPIFEGEDIGVPDHEAIDSDHTLRQVIGWLTLRPGDTDRDYFDTYTDEQMDFAQGDAEELSMFSESSGSDVLPLVDVA